MSSETFQKLARIGHDVVGPGLAQLRGLAKAPEHADATHAVGTRAFDIEAPVADHAGLPRRATEFAHGLADQGRLFARAHARLGAEYAIEQAKRHMQARGIEVRL